jgi:radical SAM superfamily enzyme YgiQ (UPF0313 family)
VANRKTFPLGQFRGGHCLKIVFIEPKSPGIHVYSHTPMPRLGSVLLATILRDNGFDAHAQIEELGAIDMESIGRSDVVGISIITSTAPRGYELAEIARGMGKTVIIGGPHATYLADEAILRGDYVFRGEADEFIVPLMHALKKNSGFKDIPGLTWLDEGRVRHNDRPGYCKNLDSLPSPDFKLISNATRPMSVTPIFTSRGCPFDCEFCSVTDMFGRNFRFKSNEKVLEDLRKHKQMMAEGGILSEDNHIFFYDDNFTINKKRVKSLLRSMIAEGLTPPWSAQASSDVADDEELLSLIREANCFYLYIGFESINPATLAAYNKKHSAEKVASSIKKINSHGIKIHGMFVVGADTDDKEVIRRTTKFAIDTRLASVQFMILTPLPGSRVYEDFSRNKRITSYNWGLYDTHHVVFKPKHFTEFELQMETAKAMLKFYSWSTVLNKLLYILFHFKNVKRELRQVVLTIYGHFIIKEWVNGHKGWISSLKNV